MNNDQIAQRLILQKKNLQDQIYKQQQLYESLKKEVHTLDNLIFKTCQHVWVQDTYAMWDDLCKTVCQKCGLYPREEWYE